MLKETKSTTNAKQLSRAKLFLGGLLLVVGFSLTTLSADTSQTTVSSSICNGNAPVITMPADGSTSSSQDQIVSGTADAGDELTVQDNGQNVGLTTATGDSTFTTAISLVLGINKLDIKAVNGCGQVRFSSDITVNYKPSTATATLPSGSTGSSVPTTPQNPSASCHVIVPVISTPKNGDEFFARDQVVVGQAGPGDKLTITDNNRNAGHTMATNSGLFRTAISLAAGDNILYVSSTNVCGQNSVSNPIRVTFTPAISKPTGKANHYRFIIIAGSLLLFGLWYYYWRRHRSFLFFGKRRRQKKEAAKKAVAIDKQSAQPHGVYSPRIIPRTNRSNKSIGRRR